MIMTENNRKYIAEAWIDNGEDEEYKKSFLESLLEQWQGHTNGFDADTVDEMHWSDIEEYITNQVKYFMTAFQIGTTVFTANNEDNRYNIGFDGIKLYNFKFQEGLTEYDKTLPWSINAITEEEEIPTLLQVINQLYTKTFVEGTEYETNTDLYNDFNTTLTELSSDVNILNEGFGDKIVNGQLMADAVNGFRFFIFTNTYYESKEALAAQYDPNGNNSKEVEDAYNLLSSPYNVFFIKSLEEIEAAGYSENDLYNNNPDSIPFNHGYEFRIATVQVFNVETEELEDKKMLQYRYKGASEWENIEEAWKFIEQSQVEQYVYNTLENKNDYTLNSIPFQNAFYTSPLKQEFIKGALYDSTEEVETIISNDGYSYLNLTSIKDDIEEEIDDVQNDLNDYKERLEGPNQNTGLLGEIKSSITALENRVNNINDNSLPEIKGKLGELDLQVKRIKLFLDNIYNWQVICDWDGTNLPGHSTGYKGWANKDFVVFRIFGTFKNVKTSWQNYGESEIVGQYYRPSLPHVFVDWEHKILFRIRDHNGMLEYKSLTGSNISSTSVYVETVWKARGGASRVTDYEPGNTPNTSRRLE